MMRKCWPPHSESMMYEDMNNLESCWFSIITNLFTTLFRVEDKLTPQLKTNPLSTISAMIDNHDVQNIISSFSLYILHRIAFNTWMGFWKIVALYSSCVVIHNVFVGLVHPFRILFKLYFVQESLSHHKFMWIFGTKNEYFSSNSSS